jgi:hypothetical protein
MILDTLILQHSLFAVSMTDTEPDSHGNTPMDYAVDSEAYEVYQRVLCERTRHSVVADE